MLTAKQAREAYAGTLEPNVYIPHNLRQSIDETIRMALVQRHRSVVLVADSDALAAFLERYLQSFQYSTRLVPVGPQDIEVHVSWSSIVIP